MSEQVKSAIERAKEYGIDVTLLEGSLRMTLSERMQRFLDFAEFVDELQQVHKRMYGDLIVSDKASRYPENPR